MFEVKNLSITYKSTGQEVIKNLSFEVKQGEILAIMGPSGCGKTTLLNAIQGIKKDEMEITGVISINDEIKVRTVFQEPRLLPWRTVIENIDLVAINKSRSEILERIEQVGLKGSMYKYPAELSLGMQHRVNFLRARIGDADILLLDEPFSSLDRATKARIMGDFKQKISENKTTTIFVTHDEADAKYLSQRIIYLSSGPAKLLREATYEK